MWWALFLVLTVADRLALLRFVPLAHRERYRSCKWTPIVWIALICRLLIPVVAGVQAGLGDWPPFPAWMRLVGAGLFIAGSTLSIWAFAVNPHFLPTVQRPPYLVTVGIYGWLHHPGYIGYILLGFGSFLILGQDLAILPTGCYVGILLARIITEDGLLRNSNAA